MAALAVKPDPSLPGDHLLIKEVDVVVEESTTTLTITGQDFNFVNLSDLVITLGDLGPLTILGAPTATNIVATYPDALTAGEYLLSVSTGSGQSKHDEYDLTIGAVGPQGEAGPQGEQGPMGPQGDQGPPGNDGQDGQDGAQGPPGPAGPAGADGSAGILDVIEEVSSNLTLQSSPEEFRIACPTGYVVLSAGIQGLSTDGHLNTLRADRVTNEAVIEVSSVLGGEEGPDLSIGSFTGVAICGKLAPSP